MERKISYENQQPYYLTKIINLNFRGQTYQSANVNSYKELIKCACSIAELEYNQEISEKYSVDKLFDFWLLKENETFPVTSDIEFQTVLTTHSQRMITISLVENLTKINSYKAHLPVEDRLRMFERQLTSFKEN